MRTQLILAALVVASAGAANAQSAQTAQQANEARCQQLAQEINAQFKNDVLATMPKTDPGTFNQNGYDVKGILMQDSSAGLWKLAQLNFGNILQNLVNNGLQQAVARGQQNFRTRMNSMLGEFGISGAAFQQAASTVTQSVATPTTATPGFLPQSAATTGAKSVYAR